MKRAPRGRCPIESMWCILSDWARSTYSARRHRTNDSGGSGRFRETDLAGRPTPRAARATVPRDSADPV